MNLDHYRFRSVWHLDAPTADVYGVLEQLGDYPAWWPEVRRAEPTSEHTFELTCRSILPYDLVFATTQERRDPAAGVLQATMAGDLDGWSRWTITPARTGTIAVFEEEVDVTKRLLQVTAPVARPAFWANHWLMMRHGRTGLGTYLAGYGAGRQAPPAA